MIEHAGPDVAVIGLGRMGAALARALKAGGKEVGGWARSLETRRARADICPLADTLAEAIGEAPLILLCLPDYDTSGAVLDEVADRLAGRTVVQLSSGTPADAADFALRAHDRGARYLDGAIATFPRRIGDHRAAIFLSGDADAWTSHARTLRLLGGETVHLSTDVTAAATADLAWLSIYYGLATGLLQGAAYFAAGGFDPKLIFDRVPSFLVEMEDACSEFSGMIAKNDYAGDQATIEVHRAAVDHLVLSARALGIDGRFLETTAAMMDDVIMTGGGQLEMAALYDVILSRNRN